MSEEIKVIKLAGSCYYNMLRTIVEESPREPTGYLYGIRQNRKVILFNAFPIQTAVRKPTEVSYGNGAAIERLRKLDEVTCSNTKSGTSLIGGYHGHGSEALNKLTREKNGDLDFIKTEEMDKRSLDSWIEIILQIEQKEYQRKMKLGEFIREREKRIETRIQDEPYHSYRITLSAHLIDKNMRVKEIKLRKLTKADLRRSLSKS